MARRPWLQATVMAIVVVVLGAAHAWRPQLTVDRDVITSTPGLAPLADPADFKLRGGQRLCVSPVVLTPQTARAQFALGAAGSPARDVRVQLSGPGYRAAGRVAPLSVHPPVNVPVAVAPPARTLVNGKVCLVNGSRHALLVRGANDARSISPAVTTVDGRPQPDHDATLLMLEAQRRSISGRLATILDRASALTGGLLPAWLLWPLLLLALVAVPVAVVGAFVVAISAESRRD